MTSAFHHHTAPSLLTVSSLSAAYGNGSATLRGADFELARGETLALVGESGSGKTTLAMSLLGLLAHPGRITAGSAKFDGLELRDLSERGFSKLRGRRIGLVPQDPSVSLNPVKCVGEQIAEAMLTHGLENRAGATARMLDLLKQVGIDRPELRAQQYPHELSGGMRQRILIAIALSCKPDLIIADEPTSALDATVQKQVLDTLSTLTKSAGTAVLLVTHDLAVASDRADRVLVMQGGEIVEAGEAKTVFANPVAPYTRALVAAAPTMRDKRLMPARLTEQAAAASQGVLQLSDISKRFAVKGAHKGAGIDAVREVSLIVRGGSTLALVGESGSGKSTLARITARLTAADSGSVLFDGADITSLRGEALRQLRANIQFVYQNPYESLSPRLSIAEIIAEPLAAFGQPRAIRQKRVEKLLDQVGLPSSFASRKPRELSGGQRQRIAIARAIALNPRFLILDEPVSALDVSIQAQILRLLVDLQGELGLGYLFITHDLAVVRQVADQVAVMRSGIIVEQGEADAIIANPVHDYTRRLLEAVPEASR